MYKAPACSVLHLLVIRAETSFAAIDPYACCPFQCSEQQLRRALETSAIFSYLVASNGPGNDAGRVTQQSHSSKPLWSCILINIHFDVLSLKLSNKLEGMPKLHAVDLHLNFPSSNGFIFQSSHVTICLGRPSLRHPNTKIFSP